MKEWICECGTDLKKAKRIDVFISYGEWCIDCPVCGLRMELIYRRDNIIEKGTGKGDSGSRISEEDLQ